MNIRTVWMLAREVVFPVSVWKPVTVVARKEGKEVFLVVSSDNGMFSEVIRPEVWRMALKEAVGGLSETGPIETAAKRQPFMSHFTSVSEAVTNDEVYYQYHYKGEIVATLLKPLKTPL